MGDSHSTISDINRPGAINNITGNTDERKRLLGNSEVAPATNLTDEEKRKKKIKYAIFGGIGLLAVVLAIVLPLTLGHRDPPRPDPIGPNPLPAGVMNPYKTKE